MKKPILLKETTKDWNCANYSQQNHTYLVLGNKCLGYIKAGTETLIKFSAPMMFNKARRTFKQISGE